MKECIRTGHGLYLHASGNRYKGTYTNGKKVMNEWALPKNEHEQLPSIKQAGSKLI